MTMIVGCAILVTRSAAKVVNHFVTQSEAKNFKTRAILRFASNELHVGFPACRKFIGAGDKSNTPATLLRLIGLIPFPDLHGLIGFDGRTVHSRDIPRQRADEERHDNRQVDPSTCRHGDTLTIPAKTPNSISSVLSLDLPTFPHSRRRWLRQETGCA